MDKKIENKKKHQIKIELEDNIKKFENKFGEIKTPAPDSSTPGFKLPDDVLPN